MNFLRKKTTAKRVGYHPSHVMRLVRANKFPRRFSSARTQSRSSKRKWTPGCRPASPSAMSGAIRRRPSTRVRSTAAVPRNGSSPRRQRDGMADHKDEGARVGDARPLRYGFVDSEHREPTPNPKFAQSGHLRRRCTIRHVQHSLADALVQAAIKSGKLERLKAAIREGRFDG